jgi:predicted anti-sigma-YlaC factor YlaD
VVESECLRVEEAVAAERELDQALREHVRECPPCRALTGLAALAIVPVPTDLHDSAVQSVLAAAQRVAERRDERWQRARRWVPVAVGLAGYLLAVVAVLSAVLPGVLPPVGPDLGLAAPQMTPPAATPAQIGLVFAVAAAWTALIAVRARSLPRASQAGAGGR